MGKNLQPYIRGRIQNIEKYSIMWETTGWNHKKCDSFTSSSLSLSLLFLWICPQVWRGHGWNLPDSSPPPISKAFNFGLWAPLWLWVWGHNELRIILKQHSYFLAPAMFKILALLHLSGVLRQSLLQYFWKIQSHY